jgi:hypothetical protein
MEPFAIFILVLIVLAAVGTMACIFGTTRFIGARLGYTAI